MMIKDKDKTMGIGFSMARKLKHHNCTNSVVNR